MLPILANQVGHSPAEEAMLEHAVVNMLQQLHVANGGYLHLIGFYNGELDTPEGTTELFGTMMGSAPAVLVATTTARPERKSNRKLNQRIPVQLELLVVSNHLRDHQFRVHADAPAREDLARVDDNALFRSKWDPGIYRIMADVRSILFGRDLGVANMSRLEFTLKQPVIQARELTLWRMQFEGNYAYLQDPPESLEHFAADSVSVRMNLSEDDAEVINPIVVGEVES